MGVLNGMTALASDLTDAREFVFLARSANSIGAGR